MGKDKNQAKAKKEKVQVVKGPSAKTKDRKRGKKVRKTAPARRQAVMLDKFIDATARTRVERGRQEAVQHQNVRDNGADAAMNQTQLKEYLTKTKVRPMDPKKIARQFCPNGY